MLYPQRNETREVHDLSGVWRFKIDPGNEGVRDEWFNGLPSPTIPMPVPASYNDITQEAGIRDHVGFAWYETELFVPAGWRGRHLVLRFGSVTHGARVWVNGTEAGSHHGGFLPFEVEVTGTAIPGARNRLTVQVDNRLTPVTLPPGFVRAFDDPMHPPGHTVQEIQFDFFNYAGIHRPVKLLALPPVRVEDIVVRSALEGDSAKVEYRVDMQGRAAVSARLLDAHGGEAGRAEGGRGTIPVLNPHLWRPGAAYLYELEVTLTGDSGEMVDVYREPVGIRTVEVKGTDFLINGDPFYFAGFGKHEDSDIRGRGYDAAVMVKDFNLMKWIGVNSFRTSHYPHCEEIMRMADREGFVVIDEVPAVGLATAGRTETGRFINKESMAAILEVHKRCMAELIRRDKNHPCVVMWCMANEAPTGEEYAEDYFRRIREVVDREDPTRPATIVDHYQPWPDHPHRSRIAPFVDVVCFNRYPSWYTDEGRLDVVEVQLERECRAWFELAGKPVILTEHGVDTIPGYHSDPPVMFSEEYQCAFLRRCHAVFDRLDFVIGEHVWNFADFATEQASRRVMGNKKGIFTRQRQPKSAAHLLRERWRRMAAPDGC